MIFNSVTFIVFLAIVVVLYWQFEVKKRLWLIFLSSLLFYGFWRVEFLCVILLSALVDYLVSLELGKENKYSEKGRKYLVCISLTVNLGLLFVFKYLYFFVDNAVSVLNVIGFDFNSPTFQIILPLGISFYTFQTISYTIDVYRGHFKPIKNFALYGSYVTFFPQLVAGPILRASEVTSQLIEKKKFKLDMLQDGVRRILYGLFLKVVLADNIAPIVDKGFEIDASAMGGLDVWTLAFLFGFQIYFDFAGYSHVAIGCARLMGINLPENFNFPYAARSFRDFWKRWHISLSSWIRDYLYLPIAGVKVRDRNSSSLGGLTIPETRTEISKSAQTRALFITWGIMGLWHGASWSFVVWGLYHAIMVFFERKLKKFRDWSGILTNKRVGWFITLPLAMLGWIPFRANDLKDVGHMFTAVLNPATYIGLALRENVYIITALLAIFVILAYELDYWAKGKEWLQKPAAIPLHVAKYTVIILLTFVFFRPIQQFIYFQF